MSYPYCGDGILQLREQCDRGTLNGQVGIGCSVTCQISILPTCGDGIINVGEECDDGNLRDGDGCTTLCRTEQIYCPDGKVCGNNKCSNGTACVQAFCGDGIVQSALGEQCDDGNRDDADDCTNACTWVALPECGDGLLDPAFEQCDNGSANANSPNAECRANCVLQRCGDGIWDSFLEECDDGNNLSGDSCSSVCTVPPGAAPPPPPPSIAGSLVTPTGDYQSPQYPSTVPTPARTPTGPGFVIFLASGAAAGVGIVRRRLLRK